MAAQRKRSKSKSKSPAKTLKGKAKAKDKPRAARRKRPAKRSAAIGDPAVKRATGKGWREWFALLDKAGAATMAHRDIAKLLSTRHKLADWWSQMVTVGYERAKGMRELHQTAKGFNTSVSRTLATGLDQLFEAWASLRISWISLRNHLSLTKDSFRVRS